MINSLSSSNSSDNVRGLSSSESGQENELLLRTSAGSSDQQSVGNFISSKDNPPKEKKI